MNAPTPDRGGIGQATGANALRGVLVLLAAVIVGVVLMNRGLGGDDTETAGGDDGTTETTETTVEGTVQSTTTTTAAPVTTLGAPSAPSDVNVVVVNANGTAGIAGRGTEVLDTFGYTTLTPSDARADRVGGPSEILFTEGFEADARAVADAFGADADSVVTPLTDTNAPMDDLLGADVIVVVGGDGLITP